MPESNQPDRRVWDRGTPFESGPDHGQSKVPQVPHRVWDRGTPFESYEELPLKEQE